MAFITAETRSSIVELAMGMLNQAPSSKLLTTLIGKSTEGASLQDLADYIATTDAFTAEYPATQTAREFATEMFGKLITGGTLDADINTAVIDLLEGLLIAGTTKAEGFVAVINFLADSANADHPDLGDIAQAFQNRADAAEYFSITKELGDSSDADLAAAIALVTSDAATLTAANAAADATASSAAPVASQTLTLTTGVETISGTIANETINAPAASATTGAAATTLDSGDVIDGGAGTDTLNITMTATNNNSLAGVTVKNVEKVYVTGANFQTSGATGAALATATATKAATAASLTSARAAVVTSQSQDNAADAVVTLATEGAIARAATATVASAAADKAAAMIVQTLGNVAITGALANATATSTAYTNLLPAEKATITLAQFTSALNAATNDGAGAAVAGANIDIRATALVAEATAVEQVVLSTQIGLTTAVQQKAAAIAVAAILDGTILTKSALTGTALTNDYTALSTLQKASFTEAQYKAALVAAVTDEKGNTLAAGNPGITAEKAAEVTATTNLATYEGARGDFTLAELNAAAGAALKSATGSSLVTSANDDTNVLARATALATASAAAVTAADTEAAKAVVADNTAASALAVATAAAAAVADASLSGASFAGSTEVWMVGANSNKTDLTVTTQTAGLSGVTGLDNKITFGATGTLAVIGSSGTVDIAGAAGGLTIGGTSTAGTGLTLKNTAGTTAATGVKALTVDTSSSAVLNLANLGQLTSVTSTGEGGVTIAAPGIKVATIATGEGNDRVAVNTTTAKDNTTTAANETVSSDVVTGAGNDTVNINTSSDGVTSVATGAGKDTVYVSAVSTGTASVTTGEGDDTVDITAVALGTYPSLTVGAGDGTDTLVTAGATFNAVDYLRMNTALSGFEAITFNSAVGALDVSKLAIGSIGALNFQAGANVVTKVAGQTLTLTGASALAAVSADGITPAKAAITGGQNLEATAAGYVQGIAGTFATNYAGSLSVISKGNNASTINVHAESATIDVVANGGSTATAYVQTVTTGSSDVKSLTVNLSSAQGSGTNLATPYLATFNAGTVTDTSATGYAEHLRSLSSLTVTGDGVFTINTSGVGSDLLVDLTTIDLSGMTAKYAITSTGLVATPIDNLSTSLVTLNGLAAETVLLGGAEDTVVATTSTVKVMDTITGFELTANATNALLADITRSDVLNLGGLGGFAKFTSTTATTLAGILTEAGSAVGANLVFNFGGDTYVYSDKTVGVGAIAGLDETDILVKLTGTLDLDQLITANVII